MWLVILMKKPIFHINYYQLTHKFQDFIKAFASSSSTNLKLLKIHLSRIAQSGGLLGRLLGPFHMKNVLKPLAKSVLIPLRLTTAAIQKKIFRSCMTTNLRQRNK